jgi:hypothetical protein
MDLENSLPIAVDRSQAVDDTRFNKGDTKQMETMNIEVKGRTVKAFTWTLDTKETVAYLKDHSVKDLSWKMLSDKKAQAKAAREMDGESATTNFALSIFEKALDITLGLTAFQFIRDRLAIKRCPRTFRVAVTNKGDVFIVVARKGGGFVTLEG